MKKNNKFIKILTIVIFLGFTFIVPIVTLSTSDKKISEVENKVLTQLPELSFDSILSKRFMENFDKYTPDQFPLRSKFIELKNSFSYLIGKREFRDIYISKDRLLEKFTFNEDNLNNNLDSINKASQFMLQNYDINSQLVLIPTSIEFYKDELPKYAINDNQKEVLKYTEEKLKNSSINRIYSPYEVLELNKYKYIYFKTDHHWTQLGAYLAYLDMFGYEYNNTTLDKNYTKVSDDFLGSYYSKALLPNISQDSIYAYMDFKDFKMNLDFSNDFDSLYNSSKLEGKNKYQYFLNGDPGFALIEGNPNQTEEVIIFKDSYAHSFIPFLTKEYKKIHVVDPRYYKIDLEDYLSNNKGITEAIFINNLQLINSEVVYK